MKKLLQIAFPTLFLVIFLGLNSCNKKEEIETVPLGSVNINMYEVLGYSGKQFGLEVLTDDSIYPPTYQIRSSIKIEGTKITVTLLDIEKAGDATNSKYPLRNYVTIGGLADGDYNIEINVADSVNAGTLQVNPIFYTLSFASPELLTLNYDSLGRVPDGALWGYVAYNDSTSVALAQSFVDTLVSIGSNSLNVAPGNYYYFQYSPVIGFTQPTDTNYNYTTQYFLQYNESFSTINDVVYYYNNSPDYKKIHIAINWFSLGTKKSAAILPENFLDEMPFHKRFR